MPTEPSPRRPGHSDDESGIALILVVIFSVLLFVLVGDLVTSARMASSTGKNDAQLASMENHMFNVLHEIVQMLKDDLSGGEGEGGANPLGGAGAGGGGGGNPLGGAGAGGAGGEEEEEPPSDSSNDAWFYPTAYSDGELTTYAYVEDENRKFNVLALASPDEEFADESKERLERLIVGLRENTSFEISRSEATTIVNSLQEWLLGQNRDDDNRPRPKLKSDDPNDDRRTIPLHLDEILLQRGVTDEIFYDLILEGPPVQVLPGLESVLTIYTSYREDPGDPEKNKANASSNGNNAGQGEAANNPAGGNNENATPKPSGIGIKINVNTASRAVLRCLFTEGQIPNSVIEGILKYRNEEAPEEEGEEGEVAEEGYGGDVEEGLEPPRKIFTKLEDLENVPEFANIADPKVKQEFLNMLTVESDVFTVHMACVYKRNEERKMFVMTRRRCVFVRLEGEEEPRLYPIIRMERRRGTRVFAVDFPEEEAERRDQLSQDMDDFSMEERKWNPFYIDFYKKPESYEQR